ncbi:MAG: thioredoxin-disulfide reductase [Bacteroidaceae bacterium]|nr:thioredoxin-disulfide reductase [Bacteroidaceae bacterium]
MITKHIHMKTVIIGSGPAGYTAAIYASRSGLDPVLYEGDQPGGQLTQTTEVDNFPGYPEGTTGNELMDDLRAQAERMGTDIRMGTVVSVDFSMDGNRHHRLTIDDGTTIEADTVIISTGASAKYLGLADEEKYRGMGVSACATCDGFFYRKKTVAVVGGGDTACEEAQYLAGLCKKVYMIVRRDALRASEAMQQKIRETSNIEILWNTQVLGLYGTDGVEGAHLSTGTDLPIDGLFLAIGHHPNSDIFRPALECDAEGYIMVQHPTTATNIPGVFACGDVADPLYRQAISAAGSGCRAAMDARKYLTDKQPVVI